jgi:hypothetical protein
VNRRCFSHVCMCVCIHLLLWARPRKDHHYILTRKCKNYAWLALQNRLWTADRLEKRGWPNCGLCPLCKQTMKSANHLFVHCRFTRRIWELLKEWIGLHGIHPRQWSGLSINEWWTMLAAGSTPNRKALASLALLTVWEVWLE